jgi:hypothetical protein
MSNRWGLQLTIYDIDNRLRESVAEVLNHPLKDTLNYLPQCLLIGGVLHEYSDAEDVSPEQITRRLSRSQTELSYHGHMVGPQRPILDYISKTPTCTRLICF